MSFSALVKTSIGLFLVITIAQSLSSSALRLGDEALIADTIPQAHTLYTAAKILNPFNQQASTRRMMAYVVAQNRKGDSEETTQEQPTRTSSTINQKGAKAVLGNHATIPVLMYHYIRINPWPDDTVGFGLSVTPYMLDLQMRYLSEHNYHTLTLRELDDILFNNSPIPDKPIIITLDDGYKDAYTQAFPILKKYGLKAVEFVITGFVEGPIYLTWDQIVEMDKSGIFDIESHTVNHTALTSVDDTRVLFELTESKEALQEHLGHEINWFAYPYGNVDERVAALVPKAGYTGAFGTHNGLYQSTSIIYTLPRIKIGGGDSVESFAQKLPWKD